MSDQKDVFREYYRKNLPILPPGSKFRQFKVKLFNGTFVVIRKTIKTPWDLQKELVRLAPCDVYFSTSTFLKPVQVGPKKYEGKRSGYNVANNLFLSSGFFLDIDEKYPKIYEIYDYLLSLNFKKVSLIETNRGYQIHCYDKLDNFYKDLHGIMLPRRKEEKHYLAKKILLSNVKTKFPYCKFDEIISTDTRRVCRVAGTLHNSGKVMKILACSYR